MKTIIIKRTATEEEIETLAIAKGYTPTIEVEKEVENEGTIAFIMEEQPNPEKPEQFIAKLYQNQIDNDILQTIKNLKLKEVREKQNKEIKGIEQSIEKSIENSKIEID